MCEFHFKLAAEKGFFDDILYFVLISIVGFVSSYTNRNVSDWEYNSKIKYLNSISNGSEHFLCFYMWEERTYSYPFPPFSSGWVAELNVSIYSLN